MLSERRSPATAIRWIRRQYRSRRGVGYRLRSSAPDRAPRASTDRIWIERSSWPVLRCEQVQLAFDARSPPRASPLRASPSRARQRDCAAGCIGSRRIGNRGSTLWLIATGTAVRAPDPLTRRRLLHEEEAEAARARLLVRRPLSHSRRARSSAKSLRLTAAACPVSRPRPRATCCRRPSAPRPASTVPIVSPPAPGALRITYTLNGMATETREVVVRLDATTSANVVMAPEAIEESIQVIGETVLVDPSSAEVKTSIENTVIEALPVGQDYRDLVKLDPRRPVHRGSAARSERRRQRPGQHLPLRRRERDPAAVRHALGRAVVARHRAGRGRQGRRQRDRLQSLRRLHDQLDQPVGTQRLPRLG